MPLVEGEFLGHFPSAISGREDLEDDLGGDAFLFPLQVGSTLALRAAEGDEDIGGDAGVAIALDGIPEEVGGDEGLAVAGEPIVQTLLDRDDPAVLSGALGHRLTVGLRVVEIRLRELCGD
jgi:hypothetical protein